MKGMIVEKLPYKCKEVLELYGALEEDVQKLEGVKRALKRQLIQSEMYYSNKGDLSYATLVVFLPWTFHVEVSKFDLKAYKKWHPNRYQKPVMKT